MKNSDVILINTPLVRFSFNLSGIYPLPHLGLGYLGAILKQDGFQIGYLDAQFQDQNPVFHPKRLPKAPVYALTAMITNVKPVHDIARAIRNIYPDSKIILGGPCNIIAPEILFEMYPAFDILVTGEGEEIMTPLVEALLYSSQSDLEKIPGLAINSKAGLVKTGNALPASLDNRLHPLRSLWDSTLHKMHPPYGVYPPTTLVETARGCSYNCTFCCISKVPRERPIDVVLEEVDELITKDGINEIHFVDPTFTLHPKRTTELCQAFLTLPRRFKWSCKTRTDSVAPELLDLMAKSGCYMIAYGVESGSEAILNSTRKQLQAQMTLDALDWTHKSGIRSIGYVLVGSPGETNHTISQTNAFLRKSKAWFALFGPYLPIPKRDDGSKEVWDYNRELVRYYSTGHSDVFKTNAPSGHTHLQIKLWMLRSVMGFYLYPPVLWQILKGFDSGKEILHYLQGGLHLVKETGLFFVRWLTGKTKTKLLVEDS